MTALIKAGLAVSEAPVRALDGAPRARSGEEIALFARVAQLEEEADHRERLIASLRDQAETAYARGHKEGSLEGAKSAADETEAKIDALREGVRRATAEFDRTLASIEGLAALLARDCLEIMFGEQARSDLVIALLRKQVASIETAAVVAIDVSSQDFPEEAARARLPAALGFEAVEIAARPLPEGSCTIRLRLGAMEVGHDRQWGSLSAALAALGERAS